MTWPTDSIPARHRSPPRRGARELVRQCRAIWEQRDRPIPADAAIETGAAHRIKTDLLELAIVWADLELRSTSPAVAAAQSEAMRVLDLADAAFGPSLAVDLRRQTAWRDARTGCGVRHNKRRVALGLGTLRHGSLLRPLQPVRAGRNGVSPRAHLRPQDFWSNFYHGLCSFHLGRYTDAVAAFRVCTALLPPIPSRAVQAAICRYNGAMAYDALGQTDRAFDEYSPAIEVDHNLAAAV